MVCDELADIAGRSQVFGNIETFLSEARADFVTRDFGSSVAFVELGARFLGSIK